MNNVQQQQKQRHQKKQKERHEIGISLSFNKRFPTWTCHLALKMSQKSPMRLHHTVWRTSLFTAYWDERLWLYCQFSLPHLYIFSLKCWENVLFELRDESFSKGMEVPQAAILPALSQQLPRTFGWPPPLDSKAAMSLSFFHCSRLLLLKYFTRILESAPRDPPEATTKPWGVEKSDKFKK